MSHLSIRPRVGALGVLGFLLAGANALPPTAMAQEPLPAAAAQPFLQGVVVLESTYEPVEAATVSLVGLDIETQTGYLGGFAFPDAPLGDVWVRVTAPGHPSVQHNVVVSAEGVVFVRFVLPSIAAVLSGLRVESSRQGRPVQDLRSAADLVAIEVPGLRSLSDNVGGSSSSGPFRLRGVGSLTQSVQPLVYVDGLLVAHSTDDALDVLRLIPAAHVESLEVLRGPAAAFLYPNAANGVIHVRTRASNAPNR